MSKKIKFILLTILAILGLLIAFFPSLYANLGTVYVKNNAEFIGTYQYGSEIRHDVVICNYSFKPETIQMLTPACHCTVVHAQHSTISPFSSTVLTMNIDTKLLPFGDMGKGVAIFFDDGKVVDAVVRLKIIPRHS